MTSKRSIGLAVVAVAALGAAAWSAGALRDEGPTHLAGATLMAGDGDERRPINGLPLEAGLPLDELTLDEHNRAVDVTGDEDGGLWVLVISDDCLDAAACHDFVARFGRDGRLTWSNGKYSYPSGQFALGPDGAISRIAPSGANFYHDGGMDNRLFVSGPPRPYSGGYLSDGTLVQTSTNQPLVAATVDPDGPVVNLMVPQSSAEEAPVRFPSDEGRLTMVVLPDDRIVLAANAPDDPSVDGQLYVLDGTTLTSLEVETDNAIRRIFPGPDGTVLALDGSHISQLDPATGTVDPLIDLSEIAEDTGGELAPASDALPPVDAIAATALGDDLVFTAEDRIWRLADAFT